MFVDELAHDVELLREWASRTPIVFRVWIFGSRVRGTHRPDSDLDVAVEHGVRPGDGDLFTTGLWEPEQWKAELQPRALLELHVQSYIPGDTQIVEAGLRESSRLIYSRPIE